MSSESKPAVASEGGTPVDEADLPLSELSETYVPDELQEPVAGESSGDGD
jgi:hypothetical protein